MAHHREEGTLGPVGGFGSEDRLLQLDLLADALGHVSEAEYLALQLASGGLALRHLVTFTAAADYEWARGLRSYRTFLVIAAPLLAIVLGVVMGVVSALKQYSSTDYTFTFLGFTGISIPDFFLGMVLVYLFAIRWPLFPTSGMTTAGEAFRLADNLRHLVLPALALGLVRTATFMRYTRNSVLEVMNNDYVRTARAKGLGEWLVVTRHILRNALVPVVTVIGLTLPVLFGGSVVIEMIFQWPGIGLMFISAVTGRDSPVIMGYVLFSAVMVQVCNLLTDLAYSFLDPRIRYD